MAFQVWCTSKSAPGGWKHPTISLTFHVQRSFSVSTHLLWEGRLHSHPDTAHSRGTEASATIGSKNKRFCVGRRLPRKAPKFRSSCEPIWRGQHLSRDSEGITCDGSWGSPLYTGEGRQMDKWCSLAIAYTLFQWCPYYLHTCCPCFMPWDPLDPEKSSNCSSLQNGETQHVKGQRQGVQMTPHVPQHALVVQHTRKSWFIINDNNDNNNNNNVVPPTARRTYVLVKC